VKSKLLSNQISTKFKARPAKGAQRTMKLSHVERLRKNLSVFQTDGCLCT